MDINNLLISQGSTSNEVAQFKSQEFPSYLFPQHNTISTSKESQQQVPQSKIEDDPISSQQSGVPSSSASNSLSRSNSFDSSHFSEESATMDLNSTNEQDIKSEESSPNTEQFSLAPPSIPTVTPSHDNICLPPVASLVPQSYQSSESLSSTSASSSSSWHNSTHAVPGSNSHSTQALTSHFSPHQHHSYHSPYYHHHQQQHVLPQQYSAHNYSYQHQTKKENNNNNHNYQSHKGNYNLQNSLSTFHIEPHPKHGSENPEFRKFVSKVKIPRKTSNGKKRKQVKKACTNCRRTHMSCDDSRPCRRCVKLGIGDKCKDGESKKRGRPRKKPVESGEKSNNKQKKTENVSSSSGMTTNREQNPGTAHCFTSQFKLSQTNRNNHPGL